MARFLAEHPSHRAQLVADPQLIPNAVEEMMRHFGIVNSIRSITRDYELAGTSLKAGDQILVPHMLWALDPSREDRPLEMDFRRDHPQHRLFGAGTHMCAGAPLVRVEIPVFWREWLKRIPEFEVAPGAKIKTHVGMMMGTDSLPLRWPVHRAAQ
jgi:cytochrome P450